MATEGRPTISEVWLALSYKSASVASGRRSWIAERVNQTSIRRGYQAFCDRRRRFATLMSQARPSLSALMPYQFMSNSYHARPWRAERMRVMIVVPAFAERQQRHPPAVASNVAGREAARCPTMCVAEFTSQVQCRPITVAQEDCPTARTAVRRRRAERRPARSCGTQCYLRDPDVKLVLARGRARSARASSCRGASPCPSGSSPCAPTTCRRRGECGSPS